jgi:hypothetical protein
MRVSDLHSVQLYNTLLQALLSKCLSRSTRHYSSRRQGCVTGRVQRTATQIIWSACWRALPRAQHGHVSATRAILQWRVRASARIGTLPRAQRHRA